MTHEKMIKLLTAAFRDRYGTKGPALRLERYAEESREEARVSFLLFLRA